MMAKLIFLTYFIIISMRTVKTWLATIAMLLCSISASAYDFEVDGIYYNILSAADRTVEVTKPDSCYIGHIIVPNIVKFNNIEFTVTRIGYAAFAKGEPYKPNNPYGEQPDDNPYLTSVVLPNTLVTIGDRAFQCCTSLKEISIPEGVTIISSWAFQNCYNLEEVNLSSRTTSIEQFAFQYCKKIKPFEFPTTLERIGGHAFQFCGNFIYAVLNHQNMYIGDEAFNRSVKIVLLQPFGQLEYWCDEEDDLIFILPYGIDPVDFDGDGIADSYMTSESMYYGIDGKHKFVLYDSESFTDTEIQTVLETGGRVKQNGIEYRISSLRNTFTLEVYAADNGITTADIASKINYLNREFTVTSIKESAFANNTALTTVKIPSSIQSIGNNAFAGCTSITSVTVESATPVSINDGCFDVMAQLFATLYVPAGAVSAYQSANVWKGFVVITEAGVSYKTITMKANAGGTIACGSIAVSNGTEYINTSNSSEEIILTPKAYHTLAKVLVDGTDVTSQVNNGVLTINVTADTEIEAIFNSQSEILLQDEQTSFELESDISCDKITYTRTLPNLDWNSLFVPFEVSVDDLTDKYDVAYINDIHSYDRDRNGTIDEMEMEVIYLTNGTLNANHPYLIRAKNEADKELTIIVNDAILYSSDNRTDISCSSVYTDFEVIGTYEKMTAQELDGCYAINTSGAWSPIASGASLNPFRLYMTITSRNGSPVKVSQSAMSRINIRVQGEDTETGIGEIVNEDAKAEIYDMTGRRLQNAHKGIYIINGKKVIK